MKRSRLVAVLLILLGFVSCEGMDGIDADLTDPQEVKSMMDFLPQDLLDAFGEENINFGPTPPDLSGVSFKVNGMDYVTSIRYLFGPTDDDEYIISTTTPPTYDATIYYHHFMDQTEHISKHNLKTVDASQNIFTRHNDTIYIIGHAPYFTAYYLETIQDSLSGRPTNYIILSGTLVTDPETQEFVGVRDYRIGKKIRNYEYRPITPSYAPGTIEVKTHEGLSPAHVWDTVQVRNNT